MLIKKISAFVIGVFMLTFFSCSGSKNATTKTVEADFDDSKNYIMTILLEFSASGEPVKIYDVITKEGFLKGGNANDVNETQRYLTVIEYADNTPKLKRSIPDPLNKVVEFVDANGNFGKKDVSLESDVVPLRVDYNKAIKDLKVFEKSDNGWALIATFPLNDEDK